MIPFIAGAGRIAGRKLAGNIIPFGGGRGRGHSGSTAYRMSADLELDRQALNKFRKQFGDTSDQALLRVALSTSRECARLTQPWGKKKDKITKAIEDDARKNINPMPAPQINRLAKAANPAYRNKRGHWYPLQRSNILKGEDDIWRFIERHRGKRGRVQWVPPGEQAVCKSGDLNKVVARRKKLAGIMKGSWFGAFTHLGPLVRGAERPTIGKNYMFWAQRHKDKGRGKWLGGSRDSSEAQLVSKVPGTLNKRYFNQKIADKAVKQAWKNTLKWYKRQCKIKFQSTGRAKAA